MGLLPRFAVECFIQGVSHDNHLCSATADIAFAQAVGGCFLKALWHLNSRERAGDMNE